MPSSASDPLVETPPCLRHGELSQDESGEWLVAYRVRLHPAGWDEVQRSLGTRSRALAAVRRDALLAQLDLPPAESP